MGFCTAFYSSTFYSDGGEDDSDNKCGRLFKSERDGRQNTESGRLCEALKTRDGPFVSVPMFPH